MRTIYPLVGLATHGVAAFAPDPNDPAVSTAPEIGDDDYGERCQRWGLTESCDYMIGDDAGTQINRAKKWQVIAGGPLNKRLYHQDGINPQEHIKVTLSCSTTNQINDAKKENFYFNGITDDHIMFRYDDTGRMDPDEPLWPYSKPCTGQLLKPLYDNRDANGDIVTTNMPAFENGQLSNPSPTLPQPTSGECDYHANYDHNSGVTFSDDPQEAHWVSCDADERLLIKVFDHTMTLDDSMDLDSGYLYQNQVGCLETNDEIKFYVNYGSQPGASQGTDKCFNNRNGKYIQDPADPNFNRDLPWHPYDNCYRATGEGELTAYSFTDCERSSMQLFLKVEDDAELNMAQDPPLPSPMRQEHLYIKASIAEIFDALEVFPTDIMRIDFYIEKGGVSKPQSFSLSPKEYSALCEQFSVADTIACQNFNVYCTAPSDNIVLRVTGGGEHLYDKFACSDLLEGLDGVAEGQGAAKWAELSQASAALLDNEKLEGAGVDVQQDALHVAVGITGTTTPTAKVTWHYDTYTKSNVPRCYTGDAFPFEVPQCGLQKNGAKVESRAHGLADLYLHNDVLNQAISGHPTHESMFAESTPGPLDSSTLGPSYNLNPDTEPKNLDTWYDFDAFEQETGYTGLITISELPICGTLQVVTPIPEVDENGDYLVDGVDGLSIGEVEAGEAYDTREEAFIFDATGCDDQTPAEDLNFQYDFQTQIQGASAFRFQTANAYGLGLSLFSLSALLAYLY